MINISKDDESTWRFDDASKSSITILSNSFQSNRTYYFLVEIINLENSTLKINDYLLIYIQENSLNNNYHFVNYFFFIIIYLFAFYYFSYVVLRMCIRKLFSV
jgi:hypothetical protein